MQNQRRIERRKAILKARGQKVAPSMSRDKKSKRFRRSYSSEDSIDDLVSMSVKLNNLQTTGEDGIISHMGSGLVFGRRATIAPGSTIPVERVRKMQLSRRSASSIGYTVLEKWTTLNSTNGGQHNKFGLHALAPFANLLRRWGSRAAHHSAFEAMGDTSSDSDGDDDRPRCTGRAAGADASQVAPESSQHHARVIQGQSAKAQSRPKALELQPLKSAKLNRTEPKEEGEKPGEGQTRDSECSTPKVKSKMVTSGQAKRNPGAKKRRSRVAKQVAEAKTGSPAP